MVQPAAPGQAKALAGAGQLGLHLQLGLGGVQAGLAGLRAFAGIARRALQQHRLAGLQLQGQRKAGLGRGQQRLVGASGITPQCPAAQRQVGVGAAGVGLGQGLVAGPAGDALGVCVGLARHIGDRGVGHQQLARRKPAAGWGG